MPKVTQEGLRDNEIFQFLRSLQDTGQDFWQRSWRESMALPEDMPLHDHESVTRFLLLRALLNQQGDTGKVGSVWQKIEENLGETLMVVDGHVGKVFCRAGAVKTVVYESKRPFIIVAKEMRSSIEMIVKKAPKVIPMFVDEGAFAVAMHWCYETQPNCAE